MPIANLEQNTFLTDSHEISSNGTILASIIERQNLIVANGSDKCSGAITRKRVTKDRVEESAIDIVMISSDMYDDFVSLQIDEERK